MFSQIDGGEGFGTLGLPKSTLGLPQRHGDCICAMYSELRVRITRKIPGARVLPSFSNTLRCQPAILAHSTPSTHSLDSLDHTQKHHNDHSSKQPLVHSVTRLTRRSSLFSLLSALFPLLSLLLMSQIALRTCRFELCFTPSHPLPEKVCEGSRIGGWPSHQTNLEPPR